MMNEFEDRDYEFDAVMSALADMLKHRPENSVRMINFDRCRAMMQTAAELRDLLAQDHVEVQPDIDISEMFHLGAITVRLYDLSVCDIPQFIRMISRADNFEIYPRTDGTIQFDMTFQSVLKTIG